MTAFQPAPPADLPADPSQAFAQALQLHQAGRLAEAGELYRRVLDLDPDHVDALHLSGVAAFRTGDFDRAVEMIGRAIARTPDLVDAHYNLGNVLRAAGRTEEALAAYGRALALRPDFPEALWLAGGLAGRLGRHEEAIELLERPAAPAEARPTLAAVCRNAALARQEQGRLEEAAALFRRAVAAAPTDEAAWCGLGAVLRRLGRPQEAGAVLRRAAACLPDSVPVHTELGKSLLDAGELEDALAGIRRVVDLAPDSVEALSNLGAALVKAGRPEEALDVLDRALELDPDFFTARKNRQLAHLVLGRFDLGWNPADLTRHFAPLLPGLWDGADLAGRTLLVHNVEGYGDAIQFVRFVPRLAAMGARVHVRVEPELHRLFAGVPGIARLMAKDDPQPPYDVRSIFQQLPHALGVTLATIPAEVPYLHPDPALVREWAGRLGPRQGPGQGLRVGLVWAGSAPHPNDHNRSLRLARLAPLAGVPGVRFYALQKGAASAQAAGPPPGMDLTDLSPFLHDFADTAAALANLDLLVSVDTSVVHLAGAIARPVWVLLPHPPDFRWLLEREDSPWYPTARLFRQPRYGDWDSVIARVAEELAAVAAAAGAAP